MMVANATKRNIKLGLKIGVFLMFYALQTDAWCYNKHRTNWVTCHEMKIRNIIFKKGVDR